MNAAIIYLKKKASSFDPEFTRLSTILPSGFLQSGLSLNNISIGDDGFFLIQNLLNSGNKKILWDVGVSLSDTLLIESNTTIVAIPGKGAVMRNNSNRPMFRNKNMVFSNHDNIIDENVTIDGGTWNGNSAGQTKKGTPEFGFNNIFCWFGVRNLTLKNVKLYTPKTYAQHAINVVNGHMFDSKIDVGSNPAINMDGVHWDGWCKNCSFKRLEIRSYDDGIGLNADDLLNLQGSEAFGFFPTEANGPISNIEIEDIIFNDSLFGIRILSGQSKVSNISIKNISGVTYNYSILIDNYQQFPNRLDKPGAGDIEDVVIDNVTTTVPYKDVGFDLNRGKISLSASMKDVKLTNISPSGTAVPLVSKLLQSSGGAFVYNYENVTVNGNPV